MCVCDVEYKPQGSGWQPVEPGVAHSFTARHGLECPQGDDSDLDEAELTPQREPSSRRLQLDATALGCIVAAVGHALPQAAAALS